MQPFLCSNFIFNSFNWMSFSLSVYLFASLFVNSSKTANPNELKFQGMIFLGMQIVLINEQPDSANRLPEN